MNHTASPRTSKNMNSSKIVQVRFSANDKLNLALEPKVINEKLFVASENSFETNSAFFSLQYATIPLTSPRHHM